MRFGDARGAECNAGHVFGRAAAYLVVETETALAHVIGDKAEQAYRRSDALEKRRKLLEAWGAYCEPKARSNVVQMRKA